MLGQHKAKATEHFLVAELCQRTVPLPGRTQSPETVELDGVEGLEGCAACRGCCVVPPVSAQANREHLVQWVGNALGLAVRSERSPDVLP